MLAGLKAQVAEALLPDQLRAYKLGLRHSVSTDKWRDSLRERWDGSLVLLTAYQNPDEFETSILSQGHLARLSTMLRCV